MYTDEQVGQFHKQAVTYRQLFESDWQQVYDFCMPARHGFSTMVPGQPLSVRVSDDTAIQAADDFTSMLVDGVCPPFAPFFEWKPGNLVPKKMRASFAVQLREVSEYALELLPATNFATEVQETFLDLVVGTGGMIMREHPLRDVEFESCPLTSLYVLYTGTGKPRVIIRRHDICVPDIKTNWPDAKLPMELEQLTTNYEKKLPVFEAWYLDPSPYIERWHFRLYTTGMNQSAQSAVKVMDSGMDEGIGSCPILLPRFRTNSGEGWGRGPGVATLPSVRVLSEVIDMIMENADIHGSGVWTADDDGITNFDNVVIDAGMVWPRMPGTKGLEGVQLPGKFDLSQFLLGDYRAAIRRAFFVEDYDTARGGAKTPVSAEQVRDNQMRLATRIGMPFVRLVREFVIPFSQRYAFILRKRGRIDIPLVDGREVSTESAAPLAVARDESEGMRVAAFPGMLGQAIGPAEAMLATNANRMKDYLAKKFRIPPEVLNSELEKRAMAEQAAQAAQSGAVDPGAMMKGAGAFMPGGGV